MSKSSAGNTGLETPEKAALKTRPGSGPPHRSSNAANEVPITTSWTPGRLTSPTTVAITVPGDSAVPIVRNHSAPLAMMCAAVARVSALLTTVGFDTESPATGRDPASQPIGESVANRPSSYGGSSRGSGSRPSMTSSSAFSSP